MNEQMILHADFRSFHVAYSNHFIMIAQYDDDGHERSVRITPESVNLLCQWLQECKKARLRAGNR